jgi:site-specific recombinase XerD
MPQPVLTKDPELAELLPSWLVGLRAEGKSVHTIKLYTNSVATFLRWCDDTDTHPRLDRAIVAAWVADLLDTGSQPSTARARHHAVKRFSAWLAREGELDHDDLYGQALPQADAKVTQPLSDAELRDLIKVCSGTGFLDRRDEAIVRLMAETGMRAGECATLALSDVDVVRGIATIRRGKGGRGRIVPFGNQTAASLDRYLRARRTHRLAATPELWLGDRGKTFSYHALHRALAKRAERAGLDRFHPHLLRHTAATRWLAAGGSEGGLMSVAGWRNRKMLDRYVAATASERAADEARRLRLGDML